MPLPRLTRDDLHMSDLARLCAARRHGYVAVLWRDPRHPDSRLSLLRLDRDEATIRRYIDRETMAECVIIPVPELLAEIGIEDPEE